MQGSLRGNAGPRYRHTAEEGAPYETIAVDKLTPIIGGVGTVFGPLLGALVVKTLGEATKLLTGDAPGLDLITYGTVLVLVIWIMPRGLIGGLASARKLMRREAPAAPTGEVRHG